MKILDHLDALRVQIPMCQVVGLADMASGLVLCVSAQAKPPQEHLDAYCLAAAEIFCGPVGDVCQGILSLGAEEPVAESVVMTKSETCLFLRSPTEKTEAMFCVCLPEVNEDELIDLAKVTLVKIASVE